MTKQNLHTHTLYCDGKDTVCQMAETAIEKGFDSLGFSGHGCNHPMDSGSMSEQGLQDYINDVLKAKEKYKDQIDIYLGIEEDLAGMHFEKSDLFDYIIGSVHFVFRNGKELPVDYSPAVTWKFLEEDYHSNFLDYARDYYEEVKKLAELDEVDIAGHIDLIMKFNEHEEMTRFEDPEYLKLAYEAIDALIQAGKIFEINTGAISRGYRSSPYPHPVLLKYIFENGGKVCITSDCHSRKYLDCAFDKAIEAAVHAGFKEIMILTPDGFKPAEIK